MREAGVGQPEGARLGNRVRRAVCLLDPRIQRRRLAERDRAVAPAQGDREVRLALLTVLALVAFAANSLLCRLALGAREIDAATFTAVRLASGALVLAAIVFGRSGR